MRAISQMADHPMEPLTARPRPAMPSLTAEQYDVRGVVHRDLRRAMRGACPLHAVGAFADRYVWVGLSDLSQCPHRGDAQVWIGDRRRAAEVQSVPSISSASRGRVRWT